MKLTKPIGKIIRFDFDENKVTKGIELPIVIAPSITYGLSEYDLPPVGLILRYNVYSLNEEKDEILGYLREITSTVLEFEYPDKDQKILLNLCKNSFTDVETDFYDKLRLPYNIFGTLKPKFEEIADTWIKQLIDGGFYNIP